jgi:hypothetical protein
MRAPNLHLHMPHWPHRGEHRAAFRRPTATEAWMVALMLLLAAAMLFGLLVALSNPGYYTGANGEYPYPLAPV